jgi:hypothetical protein
VLGSLELLPSYSRYWKERSRKHKNLGSSSSNSSERVNRSPVLAQVPPLGYYCLLADSKPIRLGRDPVGCCCSLRMVVILAVFSTYLGLNWTATRILFRYSSHVSLTTSLLFSNPLGKHLKRKNLPSDFTVWAHLTVNVEVPNRHRDLSSDLGGQRKALRLLSCEVQREDDRTSFSDSSWSVNVREEFRRSSRRKRAWYRTGPPPLQRHYRERRTCILALERHWWESKVGIGSCSSLSLRCAVVLLAWTEVERGRGKVAIVKESFIVFDLYWWWVWLWNVHWLVSNTEINYRFNLFSGFDFDTIHSRSRDLSSFLTILVSLTDRTDAR